MHDTNGFCFFSFCSLLLLCWCPFNRVGNSIIGFSIESIVLCDRKIDSITVDIFQRSKIDWSNPIFWHRKGENCQKHMKKTFFRSNRSFMWSKDRKDLFQRSKRSNFQLCRVKINFSMEHFGWHTRLCSVVHCTVGCITFVFFK